MAGDWIKMECTTPEKAETLAITAALGIDDPDTTVGKLFRLWRWFDQHTTDGNAAGVTSALIDRIVGVTGFAEALQKVGWLVATPGGITLPNFDRHNGKTAKNRALTARRVAKHKKGNAEGNAAGNAQTNAASVSGALPRVREREDIGEGKPSPSANADDDRLAAWMFDKIEQAVPGTKQPNLTKWANTIRLMRERDQLTHRRIAEVFDWANRHAFWRTNILSPDKLREKFPQLAAKKNEEENHATRQQPAARSRSERADQALVDYFAEIDAGATQDAGDGLDRALQPEAGHGSTGKYCAPAV